MRKELGLAATLLLGACASTSSGGAKHTPGVTRTGPLTTTVRGEDLPAGGGFRPPTVQNAGNLGGVIGARAEQLTASFGDARIDLVEGDARKLQFAGEGCVLDVFLYPLEPGQTPTATYVEARNPEGGTSVDEASCVRDLARR